METSQRVSAVERMQLQLRDRASRLIAAQQRAGPSCGPYSSAAAGAENGGFGVGAVDAALLAGAHRLAALQATYLSATLLNQALLTPAAPFKMGDVYDGEWVHRFHHLQHRARGMKALADQLRKDEVDWRAFKALFDACKAGVEVQGEVVIEGPAPLVGGQPEFLRGGSAHDDKAMPIGTVLELEGRRGTYKGFKKNTFGANEHTILLDDGTRLAGVKLKEREWRRADIPLPASGKWPGNYD